MGWFNNLNNTHFSPSSEETLFVMFSSQHGKKLLGSLITPFYSYDTIFILARTLEDFKDDITLKYMYQMESFQS